MQALRETTEFWLHQLSFGGRWLLDGDVMAIVLMMGRTAKARTNVA